MNSILALVVLIVVLNQYQTKSDNLDAGQEDTSSANRFLDYGRILSNWFPNYDNDQSFIGNGNQDPGKVYNWNRLQNNQNPNTIVFPEFRPQEVYQGQVFGQQPPDLNQGQPQYPQGAFQNYNRGLQNGGSSNPPDSNGANNQLPSGDMQKPSLQYPSNGLDIITTTTTTEKVAILGYPVNVADFPSVDTSTSSAAKQCAQDCQATSEYNPVCGSNNVTYFNEGKLQCARSCGIDVSTRRRGVCTIGPKYGAFA